MKQTEATMTPEMHPKGFCPDCKAPYIGDWGSPASHERVHAETRRAYVTKGK